MQTSVAKFMAQRQLQKTFDAKGLDSLIMHKPTASVAPVIQKETESNPPRNISPLLSNDRPESCKLSSSSSSSSTTTASELSDCDSKLNLKPNSNLLLNGTNFDSNKTSNSFSLLHNSSAGKKSNSILGSICVEQSLLNGDLDDFNNSEENQMAADNHIRPRNNSGDSIPTPPEISDTGDFTNVNGDSSGKSIVINTFNKSSKPNNGISQKSKVRIGF